MTDKPNLQGPSGPPQAVKDVFSKNLRTWMRRKRLSPAGLNYASDPQIGLAAIRDYMTGKTFPPREAFVIICRVLEAAPNDLVPKANYYLSDVRAGRPRKYPRKEHAPKKLGRPAENPVPIASHRVELDFQGVESGRIRIKFEATVKPSTAFAITRALSRDE